MHATISWRLLHHSCHFMQHGITQLWHCCANMEPSRPTFDQYPPPPQGYAPKKQDDNRSGLNSLSCYS